MKEQFLKELGELLAKYNADIHFYCEGDTYGIHSDRMVIDLNDKEIHSNSGFWLELDE